MPRAARQESPQHEPAPEKRAKKAPEKPREQAIELDLERNYFAPGELESLFAGDGESHKAVSVGEVEGTRVYAFDNGLQLATSEHEENARESAVEKYQSLDEAFDHAIDAVLKTTGADKEEAKALKASLNNDRASILMRAILAEHPDASMVNAIQALLSTDRRVAHVVTQTEKRRADEERSKEQMTLLSSRSELMHARQMADAAEKANDEKGYKKAMEDVYACEQLITNLRTKLYPKATPEQQTAIAEETRGAVEPSPDDLYDQGFSAVKKRLDQLQDAMRAADKDKNEVAWTIARNEFDRHSVMLPVLDQAHQIENIDRDLEQTTNEILGRKTKETTAARSRVRSHRTYWRNVAGSCAEKVVEISKRIQELQNGADYWVGSGLLTEEEFQNDEEHLRAEGQKLANRQIDALAKVKELNTINEHLKEMGVVIVLDEETKGLMNEKGSERSERGSALLKNLRELSAENPDRVKSIIERTLKSESVQGTTRNILEQFLQEVNQPDVDMRTLSPQPESTETPFVEEAESDDFNLDVEEPVTEEAGSDDFELDFEPSTPTQTQEAEPQEGISDGDFDNFVAEFEEGSPIRIFGKNGQIERGWKFVEANSENGKITVEKRRGTEYLQIQVPVNEALISLNAGPEGFTTLDSTKNVPEKSKPRFGLSPEGEVKIVPPNRSNERDVATKITYVDDARSGTPADVTPPVPANAPKKKWFQFWK